MRTTKAEIRCDPYDYLYPLRRGDVDTDLELTWFHGREWRASPLGAGAISEASVSHVLTAAATGTPTGRVPIPIFMARGFRHRCFYVRADSPITTLEELRGVTVVTNSWYDSGNTWSRAALRECGVDLGEIRWLFAPMVAGPPVTIASPTGRMPDVDSSVLDGTAGIVDVVCSGAADAALIPMNPLDAVRAGLVRRLLPDYRQVERGYFERVGAYPILHTLTLDADLVAQDPTLPRRVFEALTASQAVWERRAMTSSGGPPWYAPAFEEMYELFGPGFTYHGFDNPVNRTSMTTMVSEMIAQGHFDESITIEDIYPPFDK